MFNNKVYSILNIQLDRCYIPSFTGIITILVCGEYRNEGIDREISI